MPCSAIPSRYTPSSQSLCGNFGLGLLFLVLLSFFCRAILVLLQAVVANGVFLPIKLSVCLQRGFGCVLKQVIGCVLKQKPTVLSQSLTSKSSNVCQL